MLTTNAAATITDFHEKQTFLNTVYERFFQGFCVKVADTHGIVYTPQPLVNFMVASVEKILTAEFGKTLADKDVHILDPFTGTGTFLVRLLQSDLIKPEDLLRKYTGELHANEILLLAYYIAAINRVGVEEYGDNDFYGTSYFVDPRGKFVGEVASDKAEELVVRDLDMALIEEVRNQWAFYRDRRPEAYGSLTEA